MRKIYIYENKEALNLEPIALTRPVCDLRCGAYTFFERIKKFFPDADIELIVRDEMKQLTKEIYPDHVVNPETVEEALWIMANVFWSDADVKRISQKEYQFYYSEKVLTAAYLSKDVGNNWLKLRGPVQGNMVACFPVTEIKSKVVKYLWDTIALIGEALENDKKDFQPKKINRNDIHLINEDNMFVKSPDQISPGVVIDATDGPVIVAENVQINSHSLLRGPLYIGGGSIVQPQTFVRNCIIGPVCKIGGEVSATIIQGYSNKSHFGFLGNAYIGQWVNFGAGTTNSNLKNNYTPVTISVNEQVIETGELFIGLFAGDYSTFAIGTTLNTGTNIGPGCNVVTSGFPPKRLKPFTWYLNGRQKRADEKMFLETAEAMQSRRGKTLSEAEKYILTNILRKQ